MLMAHLKIRSGIALTEDFDKLSKQCDAALNALLPQNFTVEKKVALLLDRAPVFFRNSRPPSEEGRWVISLARKIALLKELEANQEEIHKIRFGVK